MATRQSWVPPQNQDGQILVLTTVSMIALLGIMALSLDASFMFEKRNRLHAAADAAAKSAAIEIVRNPSVSLTALEKFADQQVVAHGLVPTRLGGTTTVVVNHGPSSGTYAGNVNYVEAIVSESTSTFFASILGWMSMTPLASAVAGAGNPTTCIITQNNLSIGNSTLTLNGCGAAVGGNLNGTNPNARINGTPSPPVGVTGSCTGSCGAMGTLATGVPPTVDPLLGLAAPAMPISPPCAAGTAATLDPGCYTSIGAGVTTLNPGIYYVTGPVTIDNLSGSNVMLYLTGAGQLSAGNNKQLHLTGRTSGPYVGVAVFQDPTNASNFVTGNSFTFDVTGAVYMPGADVVFPNAPTFTSTCTLFIVKSLSVNNGNGAMSNSGCAAAFGNAAFLAASIAR